MLLYSDFKYSNNLEFTGKKKPFSVSGLHYHNSIQLAGYCLLVRYIWVLLVVKMVGYYFVNYQ